MPAVAADAASAACFAAAIRHHHAGRLAEAEALYRQALAVDPRHADAMHLLGVLALHTERVAFAVALLRDAIAINPADAAYHCNLGTALWRQEALDAAIACYHQALTLRPDYPQALFNLGTVLHRQGEQAAAVAALRRAIECKPDYAEAHNNLGTALAMLGQPDAAIACHRRALELRPHYPEALNSLGSALQRQAEPDAAVACYRLALEQRPDFAEAYFNLGTAWLEQARLDAAIGCYRQALHLQPDNVDALDNLGTALKQQGQLDAAIDSYRRAIARQPGHAGAHTNLALALLARGNLAEGWQEHEWRWQTPQLAAARRDFVQPQWRGEPAAGRRLLLHAEQGFGDTLQFCRYASLAAARGLRVTMEVQPPLLRLLCGMPDVERVIARGAALPDFDLHCPMLSMPLALGTTLAGIPARAAYLQADAAQIAAWRSRLAAITPHHGMRVGLAWAGNARAHSTALAAVDRRRSMDPQHLAPLFGIPGVQCFSLQKDAPAAPADFRLTDCMPEMTDFADTAALIANLDLVVSVDTAVAHLAAALGKPVWLLDRHDPCWRWLTGRRDSPWYPTLRIYRQPSPGDWQSVVAAVAQDLAGLAACRDAVPSSV